MSGQRISAQVLIDNPEAVRLDERIQPAEAWIEVDEAESVTSIGILDLTRIASAVGECGVRID
jgi:hypothetical protein